MILAALAVLATASDTPAFSYEIYGMGQASCATWLSTPATKALGDQWILGFWSAMNMTGQHKFVGKQTDTNGIVGDVKKICEDKPSILLPDAVIPVYIRMLEH